MILSTSVSMSKMEFNLLSFLQTKKLKKKGLTWAQHGILLNFLRDNESQTNDRNPREQGKKKHVIWHSTCSVSCVMCVMRVRELSVCACVCARACKNIGYARAHPKIQRSRTLIRNTLEHSGSLNFRCVRAFIQVAQHQKKEPKK